MKEQTEHRLTFKIQREGLSDAGNGTHFVEGPVYSPLQVDTDGESMTASDIRKMAHDFVSSGMISQIDVMHNRTPSGVRVVESYIAKTDDPSYSEGTWVLGCSVPEGPVWEDIKAGKLNGYSFDASVKKVPRRVMVDIAKIATGRVAVNTDQDVIPAHSHSFYVEFTSEGRISMGFTDEQVGHTHTIKGTVVTEEAMGHTHRFGV